MRNMIKLPELKDVVVPGREVLPVNELPTVLNEIQAKALAQQIERIIQTRLQAAMQKAVQEATVELKTYLDKILPELVASITQTDKTK